MFMPSRQSNLRIVTPYRVLFFFVVLAAALLFPARAEAKCPTIPGETICPNLEFTFQPANPVALDEVIVTAHWVDQLNGEAVAHEDWLASRAKPAYIWLWDHEPSELESTAYIEGRRGQTPLPQIVAPLTWDAESRVYQGSLVIPAGGRWYFRLGTVVPDELANELDADFDFVGEIRSIDIPAVSPIAGLFRRINLLADQVALWFADLFS